MATSTNDSGSDRERIRALLEKFKQMANSTREERSRRDEVLDELQQSVGLPGRMVTEQDILRRAGSLLGGK